MLQPTHCSSCAVTTACSQHVGTNRSFQVQFARGIGETQDEDTSHLARYVHGVQESAQITETDLKSHPKSTYLLERNRALVDRHKLLGDAVVHLNVVRF